MKLFFNHLPLSLANIAFAIALQELLLGNYSVSRKDNTGVLWFYLLLLGGTQTGDALFLSTALGSELSVSCFLSSFSLGLILDRLGKVFARLPQLAFSLWAEIHPLKNVDEIKYGGDKRHGVGGVRRWGSGQRKDNVLLFVFGNDTGPDTGLVGDLRTTSAVLRNWLG